MVRTKQLYVALPHKVGQMAKVSTTLAEAGVNVLALSVVESTEMGTLRLVVNKPKEGAAALKAAGMTVSQMDVLMLAVPNTVGMLAEVCDRLAAKKINISFAYGSTGRGRGAAHIVLACDSLARARRALADF